MSEGQSRTWRRRWWRRWAYRQVRAALALLGLMFLVYHGCFELTQVVSPSMAPTLQGTGPEDGDWVLTERVSFWFRGPRRWEVVGFVSNDGVKVLKRVAGLPGERVGLTAEGRLVADGAMQAWPGSLGFLRYYPYGPLVRNGKEATCGEGYFVLGDDSKDSQDSRYEGPVPAGRVRTRAWLRVWPWGRVGWVNP